MVYEAYENVPRNVKMEIRFDVPVVAVCRCTSTLKQFLVFPFLMKIYFEESELIINERMASGNKKFSNGGMTPRIGKRSVLRFTNMLDG